MTTPSLSEDACITESCGNVFIDLGFPPHEAGVMQLRADLMAKPGRGRIAPHFGAGYFDYRNELSVGML